MAGIQLRHGQQPLRDTRRLLTRGLTHHLEKTPITLKIEHTFDYAHSADADEQLNASLWMKPRLGITRCNCVSSLG
jgi:hypothetical protein